MHYANYTTPQLQLHYATTTTAAALRHTISSSCGWGDHCNRCNHSKRHTSNHLSVHQWNRSAIRELHQPTSPVGFLFWSFRRRLVRNIVFLIRRRRINQWICARPCPCGRSSMTLAISLMRTDLSPFAFRHVSLFATAGRLRGSNGLWSPTRIS